MYPQTSGQLATSTDGCQFNVTDIVYNHTMYNESVADYVEETFLLKIVHIAFLLVPVSGFLISYIVGIVVSLASGGLQIVNQVNPFHLNAIAWHIWPKKCVPEATRNSPSPSGGGDEAKQ